MELRQIMYILALADEGNMTRAAEKINITQPALSQTLHQIQDEIGLQLFRKDGRNLTLTEDGKFFYHKGSELVESFEEFQYLLDRRRNINQTHLRYYTDVVDNADETMLMYQLYYPEIAFERSYTSEWHAIRKLKSGELDMMITLRRIEDPDHDLKCEKLIDEPVWVLLNKDNPTSQKEEILIQELNDENLMIYQNSGSLEDLFKEFFRLAGAIMGNIREVYDPFIQIQKNGGFCFIPESTYNNFNQTHRLGECRGVKIKDEFCRRRVYLTYRDGEHNSQRLEAFFDFQKTYHQVSAERKCLPFHEDFEKEGKYGLKLIR
ncbi:MAG: LysR family transcriptional regulator [Spirochaetales bacterium]|nr:LysR family transcriptional regulator [Candidatus Physcosoma equi]